MCNLYSITKGPEAIRRWFQLDLPLKSNLEPQDHVWPTDRAPIVRLDGAGRRELVSARWWLVPPWAKELKSKYPMFNARAETLRDKASFRPPFEAGQRCLVPATGFYEHPVIGGKKTRHWIRLRGEELFAFAGLWEVNHRVPEAPVTSFVIVTTVANPLVARLHPKRRMPAILRPDDYGPWLDPATPPEDALAVLRTWPEADMTAEPVQ